MNSKYVVIYAISLCFLLIGANAAFGLGEALQEFQLSGRGAGSAGDFGYTSLWGNPAGIARTPRYCATAMFNNFWGISEYSAYSVGAAWNPGFAAGSMFFNYFGSPDIYSEIIIGASVAKSVYRIVDVGARMRYIQVGYPEPYGKASTVFLDFGLQHNFANRAAIGVYAENPAGISKLVGFDSNELLAVGLRYDAAEWATIFADVQFQQTGRGELYIGQEFRIFRWLSLSGGAGGRPSKFYLGANFFWNDFGVSWTGIIHPEMGMCNGGKISWTKK